MWSDRKIIKEGPVSTKDGKQKLGLNKWKARYARLVQDHLLIFKKATDGEPRKVYLLSECNLLRSITNTKKDNTFGLETHDKIRVFVVEDKDAYQEWLKQLDAQVQQHTTSTDDAVVPTKDRQRRQTLLVRAKKNVTGKVVSSSVGRDALKSILDEESRENLILFKQLLVSEFGEESANIIEADIIKLIVKGHFAFDGGAINQEPLPKLQDLVKKCCYLLTGAFPMTNETAKKQVLDRAAQVINEILANVETIFKPALTPKNFAKIGNLAAQIGTIEFLLHVYMVDKNKENALGLNEAMRKFLLNG